MNEEEDARFLKEAKKEGLAVPLVGEVTLTGQKVIDLAGGAHPVDREFRGEIQNAL